MFGQECDQCHEKVFIRKQYHGSFICLDCLDAVRFGHIQLENKQIPVDTTVERIDYKSSRRCTSCGRIIPEDARICPYCRRHFW